MYRRYDSQLWGIKFLDNMNTTLLSTSFKMDCPDFRKSEEH